MQSVFGAFLFAFMCGARRACRGGCHKKIKGKSRSWFFWRGRKSDFFAGRNLSSNSVFTAGGSSLNLAPIIEPVRAPEVTKQVQDTQQNSDSFVANPKQEIQTAEETQSSAPEEDQNNSTEQLFYLLTNQIQILIQT